MRIFNCGFGLALAFLVAACGSKMESFEEPVKPAKLLTLTEVSNRNSGSLPAVVRSVRKTSLAFQVGGQIIEWNAVKGKQFDRGQVIARLDSRTFQAAVQQAEAQYANAESEYRRAARLLEEDAISRSVVEGRNAQRLVAKANLDSARKSLSDTVLRAPFTGYVGTTEVEQFQNVGPQQTVLVLQSQGVEAVVNLPASIVLNSSKVRYLNTFIELDAAPGRRLPATFTQVTGQADGTTQTFEGHFRFSPPADLVVLTGMTATLFFEAELPDNDSSLDGIEVPISAVMAEGKGRYVWLVTGQERKLVRRQVSLEGSFGENVKVTEGLAAGDTIVAAGGAFLREGDKVRPWIN